MDRRDSTLESEITRARAELARLQQEKAARDAARRKAARGGAPWWVWTGVALAVGVITWIAISVL